MALSPLGMGKPTMLHERQKAVLPHGSLLPVYYYLVVQKGEEKKPRRNFMKNK